MKIIKMLQNQVLGNLSYLLITVCISGLNSLQIILSSKLKNNSQSKIVKTRTADPWQFLLIWASVRKQVF